MDDEQRIEEARERTAVTKDLRRLQESVALGMAIVQFISSPIGDALVARALEDERDVLEKLATADPDDARAIRDLQTDLARIRTWQHWLMELVTEGKNAEDTLASFE